MTDTRYDYASFLLRLWRAQDYGRPIWRASLESTQTGQRQNFTELEGLITFLNRADWRVKARISMTKHMNHDPPFV